MEWQPQKAVKIKIQVYRSVKTLTGQGRPSLCNLLSWKCRYEFWQDCLELPECILDQLWNFDQSILDRFRLKGSHDSIEIGKWRFTHIHVPPRVRLFLKKCCYAISNFPGRLLFARKQIKWKIWNRGRCQFQRETVALWVRFQENKKIALIFCVVLSINYAAKFCTHLLKFRQVRYHF